MSLKLKKSNILYGTETPPTGWVIIGVDENGKLVSKDDQGTYETIVKDSTYGIYLKLETDFLTIGNRMSGVTEALYSYSQGEYNTASGYISTASGKYTSATNTYSYVHGLGKDKNNPIVSGGINSFVHMVSDDIIKTGTTADYSAILGGKNIQMLSTANYSVVLGCHDITVSVPHATYVKSLYVDGSLHAPSDARIKTTITEFTQDELNASTELLNEIGTYEFLKIVGNKGTHIGMTVQKAIEIMTKNNLDPLKYTFISKIDNYKNDLCHILTDGYMYNFVYDELILFIMRGLSEKLNDISNRLDKIEKGGN